MTLPRAAEPPFDPGWLDTLSDACRSLTAATPRLLLQAPDSRSGGLRNKPIAYLRLKLVARQYAFKINVLSRLDAFQ